MQKTANNIRLTAVFLILTASVSPAQDSVDPSPQNKSFSESDNKDWPDIIRPPSMPVDQAENYRAQYDYFIESLANSAYSEAEVAAKNMVTLSLQHAGDEDSGLPQALINLAVAQQLAEDLGSAILNYQASIQHIEQLGDLLSPSLVAPLRGLASAQTAGGNPLAGLRTLDRALHVSNVNAGPHSSEQIPILDSMLRTRLTQEDLAGTKIMLERIHTLATRAYPPGSEELLPTLFYKADIEKQIGMQFAQRETYREIIQIMARQRGEDDFSLIDPYLKIARTYVWDAEGYYYRSLPTAPTAEWYYKKAIAIAESHPDADVLMKETCLLALADYYTIIGVNGKADTLYRQIWDLLSSDETHHAQRDSDLGNLKPLVRSHPHNYANFGYKSDIHESKQQDLLEGTVTLAFTVSQDGTTKDLEVVEADPAGFERMELRVRNSAKEFVFRPRYAEGRSVESPGQRYEHAYFYRSSDLPRAGAESSARSIPDTARIN